MTATAGAIGVKAPLSYGNKTYYVAIHNNNDFVKSEWADFSDSGKIYFGTTGALFGGLIVLAIILMAVSEGVGLIIFGSFALILITILQLIEMSWLALVSIIIFGFIIVFKLVKRRQQA
jgi:hypothetical protein